jgi:hypothetical protein
MQRVRFRELKSARLDPARYAVLKFLPQYEYVFTGPLNRSRCIVQFFGSRLAYERPTTPQGYDEKLTEG